MKKIFGAFLLVALLVPSFSPANAMTQAETESLIKSLLVQVMQLQQQLMALMQQRDSAVPAPVANPSSIPIYTPTAPTYHPTAYTISLPPVQNLGSAYLTGGEKGDMTTNAALNLGWNIVSGAVGYNLYRSTDPSVPLNSEYTIGLIMGTTVTNYSDYLYRNGFRVLAPDTYYYKVVPISPAGDKYNGTSNVFSNTVRDTTAVAPTMRLYAPASGTTVKKGELLTISWASNGFANGDTATIWLGRGDGSVKNNMEGIASHMASSGYYVWDTGSMISPAGTYYLQICKDNVEKYSVCSPSSRIDITPQTTTNNTLKVNVPISIETWRRGDSKMLSWSDPGASATQLYNVAITSADRGKGEIIATNVTGNWITWKVGANRTGDINWFGKYGNWYVEVMRANNPTTQFALSTGYFTITDEFVSISEFAVPVQVMSGDSLSISFRANYEKDVLPYDWRLRLMCPSEVFVDSKEGAFCSDAQTPVWELPHLGNATRSSSSTGRVTNLSNVNQVLPMTLYLVDSSGKVVAEASGRTTIR